MEIFGQNLLWAIIWIGGLILLIVLFWLFLRMSNPEGAEKKPSLKQEPDKTRKDLLKDRFARGEISKKEYEEKMEKIAFPDKNEE